MNKPAVCVMLFAPIATCLVGSGCTQAAEESICPAADVGDLVVTELRVTQAIPQEDGDPISYSGFVELYNASAQTLELRGLSLVFRSINGATVTRALVRDSISLAAGAYIALSPSDAEGLATAALAPTFGYDLSGTVPSNAQLAVSACDTTIDTLIYRALPTSGSWALSNINGAAPSASLNDVEEAWCVQTGTLSPPLGSPGAANETCEEPAQ